MTTLTADAQEVIPGLFLNGTARTREELDAAFKLVSDKTNWKLPIDRVQPLTFRQADLVREAVVFFAGCVPTLEVLQPAADRTDGRTVYRVTAVGYYAAVGA